MPNSAEAERALLGIAVLDNEMLGQMIAFGILPEDFYVPSHRRIFMAMIEVQRKGQPVDPLTVGEQLKLEGELESCGGYVFITNLTYGLPRYTNVQHYAKIVKDKSNVRQLIKVCNKIVSRALDEDDDPDTLLAESERAVLELCHDALARSGVRPRPRGFESLAQVTPMFREELIDYGKGITKALPLGLPELDDLLDGGGAQPQGLYFIAALPGLGKTSAALGIAGNVARNGTTVGVVSIEMAKLQIVKRLFSAHTGIPHRAMRPGFVGEELQLALEWLPDFAKMPIHIDDTSRTIDELARHSAELVLGKHNAGLIIVDYLQLLSLDGQMNVKQRTQEVSAISIGLKHIARDLNVPVIALSQLNRESAREGRRPMLHDLRESGQLEADAEAVSFLWNPLYKVGEPPNRDPIQNIMWILEKQRNGPTADIPVKFVREYMQFLTDRQYSEMLDQRKAAQQQAQIEDDAANWK